MEETPQILELTYYAFSVLADEEVIEFFDEDVRRGFKVFFYNGKDFLLADKLFAM